MIGDSRLTSFWLTLPRCHLALRAQLEFDLPPLANEAELLAHMQGGAPGHGDDTDRDGSKGTEGFISTGEGQEEQETVTTRNPAIHPDLSTFYELFSSTGSLTITVTKTYWPHALVSLLIRWSTDFPMGCVGAADVNWNRSSKPSGLCDLGMQRNSE